MICLRHFTTISYIRYLSANQDVLGYQLSRCCSSSDHGDRDCLKDSASESDRAAAVARGLGPLLIVPAHSVSVAVLCPIIRVKAIVSAGGIEVGRHSCRGPGPGLDRRMSR